MAKEKPKSFDELYRAYHKVICNMASLLVDDSHAGEDIAQKVFVALFVMLPNVRSPYAWLTKVTYNKVLDYWKDPNNNLQELTEEIIARVRDERDGFDSFEASLPPWLVGTNRDIIILRIKHQYNLREIAEMVGIEHDNCRVRYSRTLVRLKKDKKFIKSLSHY